MGEWINSVVYPYYGLLKKRESVKPLTLLQLFVTPWTVDCQVPLSMGFSRQGHWSGLPCPSPGYLPNPGVKSESLMPSELTGGFFTTNAAWEGNKGYLRGRCFSGCCGG